MVNDNDSLRSFDVSLPILSFSNSEESRKRRKIHGKCDFQVQNFDKRKKDDKWRSQPSSQANSIVIDLT